MRVTRRALQPPSSRRGSPEPQRSGARPAGRGFARMTMTLDALTVDACRARGGPQPGQRSTSTARSSVTWAPGAWGGRVRRVVGAAPRAVVSAVYTVQPPHTLLMNRSEPACTFLFRQGTGFPGQSRISGRVDCLCISTGRHHQPALALIIRPSRSATAGCGCCWRWRSTPTPPRSTCAPAETSGCAFSLPSAAVAAAKSGDTVHLAKATHLHRLPRAWATAFCC